MIKITILHMISFAVDSLQMINYDFFKIPDPEIGNSIPGLQSLLPTEMILETGCIKRFREKLQQSARPCMDETKRRS